MIQPVEAQQPSRPRCHREERRPVHHQREPLQVHATRTVELAAALPEQGALLAREASPDRELHQHCARGTQKLRHAAGEPPRIQLEPEFHLSRALAAVDVLAKPAEIDRLATDLGALRVELARADGVMGER